MSLPLTERFEYILFLLDIVLRLIMLFGLFFILIITCLYDSTSLLLYSFRLWLFILDAHIFEHFGEVTLSVCALLPWQDQPLSLSFERVHLPYLLIEETSHVLVINRSQSLMHATHHSDVVVVKQIYLLHVQKLGKLASFIGKEKFCHSLWDKCNLRGVYRGRHYMLQFKLILAEK